MAHKVQNNAAWDNTLHGFTENSNTGAIVLYRNTAYANAEDAGWSRFPAPPGARTPPPVVTGGGVESHL